ncbi:MAG: hypothetical protein AAFU80_17675 [Pseudomonadota bacterium]
MHRNTKIATCNYCGTRAALVLGADRHELVCSACGAPLHDLKALPSRSEAPAERRTAKPARPAPRGRGAWDEDPWGHDRPSKPKKSKKKKKKSTARKFLGEAFDLFEDIFD